MNTLPIALSVVVIALLSFAKVLLKGELTGLLTATVLAVMVILIFLALMAFAWAEYISSRSDLTTAETESIEAQTEAIELQNEKSL